RSDRPDGLVGDQNFRSTLQRRNGRRLDLIGDKARGLTGVANILMLADAQNRRQPRLDRSLELSSNQRIRFAEKSPPFGVTQDDERSATFAQHVGGDLAGQSARMLIGTILSGQRDLAGHLFQIRKRRSDDDLRTSRRTQ